MYDNNSFITSFIDFFKELLGGDGQDKLMAILLLVPVIAVIVIIVATIVGIFILLFHAFDSWFRSEKQAPGVITSKHYTSPFETPVIYGIGGQLSPETWSVAVQVGDRVALMSCDRESYDEAKRGMNVNVTYVDGRISGKCYIRSLQIL